MNLRTIVSCVPAAFQSDSKNVTASAVVSAVNEIPRAKRDASDRHYVVASKCFTAFWGLIAIAFALFANLAENLIQAVNILGSIFYGVVLGLFLVAFFLKRVGGTAAFWSALAAQALVFVLYSSLSISYLWYNVIGCAACMAFSLLLQAAISLNGSPNPGTP